MGRRLVCLNCRQSPSYWVCSKSSLEKITLLLNMFENHWCVVSTHNGPESQMGPDDLLPSPRPWSSPKVSQAPIPHVGKGNRARQHKNENHWARGDTRGMFVPFGFPGLPKLGLKDIQAGCDGTAYLTSSPGPACGGNRSQARVMVLLQREKRNWVVPMSVN